MRLVLAWIFALAALGLLMAFVWPIPGSVSPVEHFFRQRLGLTEAGAWLAVILAIAILAFESFILLRAAEQDK